MTASAREGSQEGKIKSFAGPEPRGRRPVDLVFRTVGERTSDLALELAIEHVGPQRVHVLKNVKPFSRAVSRMLELDHGPATHVVHMDADCLILEDMRPFLEDNELPYVDCYVHDRFRGRIHCGVHVTRIDVVRQMAVVPVPEDDLAYVLRPESRLRNLALAELAAEKQLRGFAILHDHFQRYTDIFAKYALRELRSRSEFQKKRLVASMAAWGPGTDYDVARAAVAHAARTVPEGAKAKHVEVYIRNLPFIAEEQLDKMGLGGQPELTMQEVEETARKAPWGAPSRHKVFGIGLSRTGSRTLTAALHVLGIHTVHDPIDAAALATIERGDGDFGLLRHYDGLTDVAAVPALEALDRRFPGAKFILTVRDEAPWLDSCEAFWAQHPIDEPAPSAVPSAIAAHATHLAVRRHLRQAVFGATTFDRARFAQVRREHEARVRAHFAGREDDLLVLDVTRGPAWEALARFVGRPIPEQPWPHKGRLLSAKQLAAMEPDD